jgi:hypothetical protein
VTVYVLTIIFVVLMALSCWFKRMDNKAPPEEESTYLYVSDVCLWLGMVVGALMAVLIGLEICGGV